MKLVIGLGNPGKEYQHTKHNVGFDVIDLLAKDLGVSLKKERKFEAEIFYSKDYILLKPMTYMNLSGNSVKKVIDFYRVEVDDILVISDDLDLALGKVRLRMSGSSGGHNGLKSIISHIGSDFKRIKLGIGRNDLTVRDQVLSKFAKQDQEIINDSLKRIMNASKDFIEGTEFIKMMGNYNG